MAEITYEYAKRVLTDLANENPDFVYEKPPGSRRCVYVYDSKPSCIIGHMFDRMGILADNYEAILELNKSGVYEVIADLAFDVDQKTEDLLTEAQYRQDAGNPWGEAINHAITAVENV